MLWNGNECGKNKYDEILKATITNTGQKQLENVRYFNHLGSITNDARCREEIKSRVTMAKVAFNKKKTLSTSKSDIKNNLKLVECYNTSMMLKLGHFGK
jgi:hypothetical protein